ncbi:PREDICTED: uncharacterized protein LOC106116898 [Papilio xuthus]|uniref:Uncharacterized protein LOC106116898 n=1 Tax=Papilio xuthus TaxID=66420 RepID=A0AAJ7E7V8_PAPXU|nr:PREDICTED: uncharacterized protein LOC106116898 [Papilio xuthus]
MKMLLLLFISCEVLRCAIPAMASTTVLAEGGDTSLMTLFLKNILNLGLGSAGGSPASPGPTPAEPNTRTCDKNIIRAFIDVKVKELKPFLQDDEYMEEEGAEGGDTAIVQPAGEQQQLEWQKIREKYSDLFRGNESVPQERLNEIVGSLMEKLPSFFANVVREGEALAEGYGIRCERLRVGRAGPEVEAEVEVEAEADGRCGEALGVCSGELRRFLVRLFKAVNESSARVLQDYLEMYKVDVNIDRVLGRRGILDTLRDINREAEAEVCKIYAKKIQSLVINEGKKRGLRAAHLTDLIKNITENVKMHTNQIIRVQMEPIDTELKERILKDLDDNMRVELDRLARDLEHTICSAFATCNGHYTVRRAGAGGGGGGGGGGAGGGRGVFVRVQLQLEERPARAPRRTASALRHSGNYTRPIQIKYSTFDRKIYDMKLLNVTRTTRFYSQNGNTKITQ